MENAPIAAAQYQAKAADASSQHAGGREAAGFAGSADAKEGRTTTTTTTTCVGRGNSTEAGETAGEAAGGASGGVIQLAKATTGGRGTAGPGVGGGDAEARKARGSRTAGICCICICYSAR